MKTALRLLWAAALLFTAAGAARAAGAPDPDGNLVGLTTPNGRLVADFINIWFNEHKPERAFDEYVARSGYMNHAVYNAHAREHKSFAQEKAEESRAAGPGTHFAIKQIVAQGNLVFVHIAATHGEGGVGPATGTPPPGAASPQGAGPTGDGKGADEMVMILRVHNGKITDHWDMHVPTNSDSAVFTGLDRALP